ncbi:MAG: DNA-binding response regulator [Halomonadaceae bacterium]|nr:MAG: DNA-binding response regulator [Halomonadaceae bacterium]
MRILLTNKRFNASHWQEFFDQVILVDAGSSASLWQDAKSIWICTAIENWRQLLQAITATQTIVTVMALSPASQEAKVAFSLGANAYIPSSAPNSLLESVNTTIAAGGYWLPKEMLLHLVGQLDALLSTTDHNEDALVSLTRRERDVCQEVAKGHSNKLIARDLGITERTVKEHLSHSFAKLNVKDRMQLMLLMNERLN